MLLEHNATSAITTSKVHANDPQDEREGVGNLQENEEPPQIPTSGNVSTKNYRLFVFRAQEPRRDSKTSSRKKAEKRETHQN